MGKPLAVRWRAHELPEVHAGAASSARVELENAGETPWRGERFAVSYHWLDALGNPIVWDGLRTPVAAEPGEAATVEMAIRAPIPPGHYRLAIDIVDESRFWLGELGNPTLDVDVDVQPRIETEAEVEARLGNAQPTPDWRARMLEAHREGYAVVGGSVEVDGRFLRRRPHALAPYAPGAGRVPGFAHPLVCASVIKGVEVEWTEVGGLPAAIPPRDEPWLYDGRITVRLPSGRRRG
jgi:hypothetical protein